MFKKIDPWQIKSIILVCLVIGSIILGQFLPIEITHSDAFKEIHGLGK